MLPLTIVAFLQYVKWNISEYATDKVHMPYSLSIPSTIIILLFTENILSIWLLLNRREIKKHCTCNSKISLPTLVPIFLKIIAPNYPLNNGVGGRTLLFFNHCWLFPEDNLHLIHIWYWFICIYFAQFQIKRDCFPWYFLHTFDFVQNL